MKKEKVFSGRLFKLVAVLGLLLLMPLAIWAQTPEQFAGNYKGTAKMASGDVELTLEIKVANGKFSGRAVAGGTEYQITSGEIAAGKLMLKFGAGADAASLSLKQAEDKLMGDWVHGTQKATVELKKAATVAAADEISGDWEAVANANGQNVPFTLTLKLDGDKITGGSTSELGNSEITEGTYKDGKLVFKLNGSSGVIAMVAVLQDGKLNGDFDFAGQMSGRWIAVKRK
jgi:hypothetical protein